jgi:VWFA-related protein
MRSNQLLPLALLLAFFVAAALGQQDAVFTSGVDVVNVVATVRDRHGRLVNDLTQDDFVLKEDGKPQTIRYFSRQADLPLTVGVLVDTSLSQRRILDQERSASYEFLARVLDETKDQAFVVRFDFEVELLQDLTSSRQLLQRALGNLRLPSERVFRTGGSQPPGSQPLGGQPLGGQHYDRQFPGGGVPDPFPGGIPGRRFPRRDRRGGGGGPPAGGRGASGIGTAMYDAVYLAADEVLRDQAGRKAMILISDGVDMGSKLGSAEAIEAAQRADAVIYAIHYSDDEGYRMQAGRTSAGTDGWRPRGEYALETLCNQTGGRLYRLSGEMTLAGIFEQIEEELRNQYSLGYTSSNDSGSTAFRRITVAVKDAKHKVFSRAGYYPQPK